MTEFHEYYTRDQNEGRLWPHRCLAQTRIQTPTLSFLHEPERYQKFENEPMARSTHLRISQD